MSFKTQMEAAKKGIITPEIKKTAEKEALEAEALRVLVAEGKVVIPANRKHSTLDPAGIGEGLKTKINVNLGISQDCADLETELEKVNMAVAMKADAVMDLSSYGRTEDFRRRLIGMSPVMVGTVPVYDAAGSCGEDLNSVTSKEFIDVVRKHAEDGVDFVTIHAGINADTAEVLKKNRRVTDIVSRGGSLLFSWMEANNRENPFYEYFGELLDICLEYDVTLSLGDAMRPGSISDATDACQIKELMVLGELTLRAWAKNVQVMIEGPGHMPLNEISANVLLQKKLCHGAPFYVLGPLVTDIAPGYDHITSAIGGAAAAGFGADFLCYVTPAEHLRLPTLEDVKEGIIASRIAAHAGDIVKNVKGAREWDYEMSKARQSLDWEKMFELAVDPEKARRYRTESQPLDEETCTMCGKICAVKKMNEVLQKNKT